MLVAINVTLVVADVAELRFECALVTRQIGGVSCCRSLATTANVFIETGTVAGAFGSFTVIWTWSPLVIV